MTLEEFAEKCCDRMYNPELGPDQQCGGWYELRKMVEGKIKPNDSNMAVFHPNLRSFIVANWSKIELLPVYPNENQLV